ncbi:hypothetical protein SRHO_G00120700 [Serrasalmus rhombeus]
MRHAHKHSWKAQSVEHPWVLSTCEGKLKKACIRGLNRREELVLYVWSTDTLQSRKKREKVACACFDVQNPPSLQRRLAAGAEEEADGPRQDAANLTSLFPFQVLQFNQPSPHKLLWSTFEIRTAAQ